ALTIALGLVSAFSADETKTDAVAERGTIVFEGIRIGFPKGEADVAEALKPALHDYLRERKPMADEEANAIANGFSDADVVKKLGPRIAALMAREAPSKELEARFASHVASLRKFTEAWRKWSGGISEVQLWARDELKPFQTREDGGEDAEGEALRFPQIAFGKNGATFALHFPFATSLIGLDALLNDGEKIAPLRLDFPLYYKPGESAEKIAEYSVKFIQHLGGELRAQIKTKSTEILPHWMLEYLLLGEIETLWVDAPTARNTALAEALARTLLFAQLLGQQGEKKTAAQYSEIFPFAKIGAVVPDTEGIISSVEKMDPLAAVDRKRVTERVLARNLIALTLIRIAQTEPGGKPIFHKFKEAGIAIPEARFNMATFTAAVDEAYGEKGFFLRMLAAERKKTVGQLRKSVTRKKENAKPAPAPAVAKAPPVLPNRESAKYDGLTITFPPELKGAMAILGPQCAKALANARAFAEALRKKSPKPAALEVTDEDLAAYRRYGLEADAQTIRTFAAGLPGFTDSKALLVRFFSGDRITIWFKEDLIALLKAGTDVPGFTLNPDGESGTWYFKWGVNLNSEDFHRLALEGKDIAVELEKRLNAVPPPEYPMVVKRADLAGKPDDPEAAAATIREGDRGILGLLLSAEKEPLKESDLAGLGRPLMSVEQAWFLVAHETAENAIVSDTIKSADRRWFCDGLANWIAIRDVDRRFGKGKGAEAFAKNYNAEDLKKHAGEVNLPAWPAQEDIDNGSHPQVAQVEAHYYFATLAIEKACEGQGGDFVKRWLEEIRRTPLNRTNSGTVMAAYQKLTGKDLAAIIAEVAPTGALHDSKGAIVPAGTNDVDELHRRGVAKLTKGDLDGAMAEFTRAIQMMPKNPAGYSNRGHVRMMKGDLDAAVADYNRALEIDPKYTSAYCGRANAKFGKGDVKGALADFTRAIEIDPNDASGYDGRGGVKYLSGDLDGALADLNRALEIDPKNTSALANRSKVRHRKGDLDGEIADYNALIKIHPKDAEAVNNRGAARNLKGDYEGAIADSSRAIELDPKYAPAYDLRGASRRSKGDLAGAIADGNRAIGLDPKLGKAFNNRGNAKWETGDNDGAIADFNRALELNPKDAIAYANRGNPRQARGDLDGALADYTRAIEL
ncbi:MAG: tetratricopeptide repeat protein, partial [Chthoniobacteraceae bacterium]